MEIPEYTADDYLRTTKPYEFVANIKSKFEREQVITELSIQAKQIDKSINFKTHLENYLKEKGESLEDHYTEFTGQPFQLKLGKGWIADDNGVRKVMKGENQETCAHPIMPIARLVNVDTQECMTELGFRYDNEPWQSVIFDRETLASKAKIVKLASRDINVTGTTASNLCEYIAEALQRNRDVIPKKKSIGRMGWIGHTAFSPYMDDLIPDNEDQYRNFWNAVKPTGDEQKYNKTIQEIRESTQVIPRIALATSLASVLVKPCGGLPFVTHIWGRTSTGKTVTLMVASAVWGNPEVGQYTRSFNATAVGLELSAAFLNNLPLILDELQTISKRKDFEDIIYELTEGTNRSRGQKDGGTQIMRQWANSIVTSGEQPITTTSSGGGMIGRIIELDCSGVSLFQDPHKTAEVLKHSYGFLGKRFVELLLKDGMLDEVREYREKAYADILTQKPNVAEKQAFSASLILTADHIATKYLLQDDNELKTSDILGFLADIDDADQNKRAYDWLYSWITSNTMHFFTKDTNWDEVRTNVYGLTEPDKIVILRSVFNDACQEAGFNPASFARWLRDNGYSECDSYKGKLRLDKSYWINGKAAKCVVLDTGVSFEESEDVPW